MELYAIAEAIKLANNLELKETVISTNSISSTQGIKQLRPKLPVSHIIKEELNYLQSKGNTVQIIWISSHIGIMGSEKADLAISSYTSYNH